MKPLLIVKINGYREPEKNRRDMETIADGIEKGAIVLSGDCEVIAFDEKGRLVYPIRPEEVAER